MAINRPPSVPSKRSSNLATHLSGHPNCSRSSTQREFEGSDLDQPELQPAPYRLGPRRDPELAEDGGEVELHRVLADLELVRDLAVRQAVGDEREHGALARRQLLEQRLVRRLRPAARARARSIGRRCAGSGGLMTASIPGGSPRCPCARPSSSAWPTISTAAVLLESRPKRRQLLAGLADQEHAQAIAHTDQPNRGRTGFIAAPRVAGARRR